MALLTPEYIKEILKNFAELMSRLMIDQHQQQIAELDLTLPQTQVLKVLKCGPCPTGHLAAELRISAPAITQLTNRLLRKGLIKRHAAADDRRCVMVTLSAKGQRLINQFCQRRCDILNGALAHLTAAEKACVAEALGKLVKALERYEIKSASERVEKRFRSGELRA